MMLVYNNSSMNKRLADPQCCVGGSVALASASLRLPIWTPWSMKMGTTLSPRRYDAAARHAYQSAGLRRAATLHYVLRRGLPYLGRQQYSERAHIISIIDKYFIFG